MAWIVFKLSSNQDKQWEKYNAERTLDGGIDGCDSPGENLRDGRNGFSSVHNDEHRDYSNLTATKIGGDRTKSGVYVTFKSNNQQDSVHIKLFNLLN